MAEKVHSVSILIAIKRLQPSWYKDLLSSRVLLSEVAVLVYLALVKLILHLATSNNYGFFRDELYFIEAGKHLDFGYVDFPAFIALLAASTHFLLGDSLVAYHISPALAGMFVVLLTGLIARELGGGRFAQCLASIASLVAPTFLGIDSLFTMNAFDELWWVLASYLLVVVLKRERPRLWLLFGLVIGLGLLTKITMLTFGFALFLGLLLSSRRTCLLNKWLWLAAAIAFAFLLPYILWEIAHGWTSIDYWQNYSTNIDHLNPLQFIYEQIVNMNPFTVLIWLAGIKYYLFKPEGKPYKVFGYAYIILFVIFMVTHAKFYFLSPAYPVLFAGGALLVEQFLSTRRWYWIRTGYISLLVVSGVIFSLLFMPILSPAFYMQVTRGENIAEPFSQPTAPQLPQPLADRFGWENMAAMVAHIYHRLPAAQQNVACIFASNYGEAGAMDYYAHKYQLPPVVSGHLNYFLWGPGTCTGEVVISVGVPYASLTPFFAKVVPSGTLFCPYCAVVERNMTMYVAYQAKEPIKDIWPSVKDYAV
jgi:hypothetical protein